MRKKLILTLLIIFIILCLIFPKEKEEILPAFSEQDYNYYIYDIDVSKSNITTKNIEKYLGSYTILSISLNINPIYQKIINIESYNFDTTKSISSNIEEFKKIYIDILNKNSLNNEAQKIIYSGVKINKITFYITNSQLDLIISNSNNILIS